MGGINHHAQEYINFTAMVGNESGYTELNKRAPYIEIKKVRMTKIDWTTIFLFIYVLYLFENRKYIIKAFAQAQLGVKLLLFQIDNYYLFFNKIAA